MAVHKLRCKRCDTVKSISEFDRGFFGKQGFDVFCHDCRVEVDKIYSSIVEKRCRQCGRTKPVSEYRKNASCRDGYSKECLDCQDENNQRRRERKNKDTWNGQTGICRICGKQKPSYEFIKPRYEKIGYEYCRSCISEMTRQKLLKYEHERDEYGWPVEKYCKGCGLLLTSDNFHLDRNIQDGLADKCKDCTNEQHTRWLEHVKEKRRKKNINKNKLKECCICHVLKPISKFTQNDTNKDGYSNYCIICSKNLREENIEIWAQKRNQNEKNEVVLKEKHCRKCNRVLPIEMFSKNKDMKGGYYTFCKDCHKKEEKNAHNRWERERKKALLEFSLDAVVEKKCKSCRRVLSLSEFWERKASKDGHSHYCKDCLSKKTKERNKFLKERGFPEELIPEEKHCSRCNRVLSSKLFGRDCTSSDGLDGYCKECRKELYHDYYYRPDVQKKKKERRRTKEYRERRRKYARNYYKKPGVKEKQREYKRKYIKRPEVKEKKRKYWKEYSSRPEVKKMIKERYKKYYSQPEVREHHKKKMREWNLKRKAKSTGIIEKKMS